MKRLLFFISLLVFALAANLVAQDRHRFTVEELLKVRRVNDVQLSPAGDKVVFTIGDVNLNANRIVTQIFLTQVSGGDAKQLTSGDGSATSPRWSPDGKRIAYVSGNQIWIMDEAGDHKKQITSISTGAGGPVWSNDGKWIAFGSEVYPDCKDDDCNKRRDEETEKNKVKAHVMQRLLYRHWVEWRDVKRTHVFVVSSDGGGPHDLTPGDFDAPPYAAATGVDYAISPDAKELAFLRNPDKVEATSTNSDIYLVPISGGSARNITAGNKGYDVGPSYTRDGKYIIYRSQATEGFEADRWRLMSYNRASGISVELTKGFDLQVEEFALSPEGNSIYFIAGERGHQPIYSIPLMGGTPRKVIGGIFASHVQPIPNGQTLIFESSSIAEPTEVYRANVNGSELTSLTSINKELLSPVNLRKAEEVEWIGALAHKIHGFIVKPADFDPTKKYPLVVLIHGGPQGAWNDSWGYRWNPQVFADAGYVVLAPNPRGSTGYGQQFVNEISGDWGGKAYRDIMNGTAEVIRNNAYIDKDRVGAAGASYGGYMINWIEGHNNDPRFQFKVLVSHDGVYNLASMYGGTEELWFPEWEFKGTPWTNPAMYQRWSPHLFVKNFKTPILVIHGELDYRVPIGEGLQLYTAAQRVGVESKLLIFPDEGHWVLKPQNSAFWYHNVLDWLGQHLKP